jgi:hypothetical protein
MKKRSFIQVFLLSLFTIGIYNLFWMYWIKEEANAKGAAIPTMWLIAVPFISLYWIWKWSEGIEVATEKKIAATLPLILLYVQPLGIGPAIVQMKINELPEEVTTNEEN